MFKDLKQILRKEQCDASILLTANVPSAKKIIVHGPLGKSLLLSFCLQPLLTLIFSFFVQNKIRVVSPPSFLYKKTPSSVRYWGSRWTSLVYQNRNIGSISLWITKLVSGVLDHQLHRCRTCSILLFFIIRTNSQSISERQRLLLFQTFSVSTAGTSAHETRRCLQRPPKAGVVA